MSIGAKLRRLIGLDASVERARSEAARAAKAALEVSAKVSGVRSEIAAVAETVGGLRREVKSLEGEMRQRLLQYNLQLGRFARAGDADVEPLRLSGRVLPTALDESEPLGWDGVGEEASPDPDGRAWIVLEKCPGCGHAASTVVCEWNKLLLLPTAPDQEAVRYNYAVCHACGLLFAKRRPVGERYRYLLRHFGEVTGKRGPDGTITNPLLNPLPLTDADRDRLRALIRPGVFVSDHAGYATSRYIGGLLRDRFENSIHFDVITSLVSLPRGARALEIRSRAGTILESLRRLCGVDVQAMPIWESQQFLIREVYGIDVTALIDFDRFTIPAERPFDLIISNHMLTHVLRPTEFFAEIKRSLTPGGHLYLHNEPDDSEFLDGAQSMIATLNPLHMQAFDQDALINVLAANGFRVLFIKARGDRKHMCLARFDGEVSWEALPATQLAARLDAYQQARDRAVLAVRPEYRSRVAGVWEEAVGRGVAAGVAEFDADGRLRLVGRSSASD
jgi:SAM-dependent methyltransferase